MLAYGNRSRLTWLNISAIFKEQSGEADALNEASSNLKFTTNKSCIPNENRNSKLSIKAYSNNSWE